MKIGLVIYDSLETVSGGYLYDRMIATHLRQTGDEVEVLSLRNRGYVGNLLEGPRVRIPPGFTVVLQDELAHPSLLAANASPRAYPVVSIVHNLHSSLPRMATANAFYRLVEKKYLQSVDGLILNSDATHRSVAALVNRAVPSVIAAPGGDRVGSLTADFVSRRASDRGPLRILFLANVIPGKALHVLLDALGRSPRDQFVLVVVGSLKVDSAYAASMQRRALELGLRVRFLGALDGADLVEQLSRAQVLAVPSDYEGFGIAYLEGMAFGLPAIATRVGAIPELVRDGTNGYLVERGDVAALAKRLAFLAEDRAELARLSLGALRAFASRPTWADAGRKIREFLVGIEATYRSAHSHSDGE
jgi:glycosyltransferase involved in cell wall biosynthesis